MFSVFFIGISVLFVFQWVLVIISYNVVNINIFGYSWQKVDFVIVNLQNFGYGDVGNGICIIDIWCVVDQLVILWLFDGSGELVCLKQLLMMVDCVDVMFFDMVINVVGVWLSFFDMVSGLFFNVLGIVDWQNVLDGGKIFVNCFQQFNGQFNMFNGEVNNGLIVGVSEINWLVKEIVQFNGVIGGNVVNVVLDLLDCCDQLIVNLVGYIGGNVVMQDGGIMNVYMVGGQVLVVGIIVFKVIIVIDLYMFECLQLVLESVGQKIILELKILGGQIGGLFEFCDIVFIFIQVELGKLVIGMVSSFNDVYCQGVDLYGNFGGDFFNIGVLCIIGYVGNVGMVSMVVSFGDLFKLDGQNVVLKFDGIQWQVSCVDIGVVVVMIGIGIVVDLLVFNGVELVMIGMLVFNDCMLLQFMVGVVGMMFVVIIDILWIVVVVLIKGIVVLFNSGIGKFSGVKVIDYGNVVLCNLVVIVFISGIQYILDGVGLFIYIVGQIISVNGWSFVFDGVLKIGDIFSIGLMLAGFLDNSNVLLLVKVEQVKVFNDGIVILSGVFGGLIIQVGVVVCLVDYFLQVQQVIIDQVQFVCDVVLGVNLDEEVVDMLWFQQVYQVVLQFIFIVDIMFQIIFGVVG